MRARTNSDVHSFSRNFRAVARSISWSALNPKSMRLSWVGGPDMAPHTPQRSARPGKAVARLDHARILALPQPEHARAGVVERLGVEAEGGELLPHHGVLGARAADTLDARGHVGERLQREAEPILRTEAERERLVHQHGQAHRPAVVDAARALALVHA